MKRSESTYNLSRGWKILSELRKFRLGGKSRFSDDGLNFRRYIQIMESGCDYI